jgi:CBS domain containing-hemolysin-like protein
MRLPQALLRVCGNVLLSPFGATARFGEAAMSEESLMDALEEGTRTGLLDRTEHELIENIFEFTETTAREIMVPRTDIVAIDSQLTPEQILEKVAHEGFTRLPVYKDSVDNIIGVIYSKDVLSIIEHRDLIILQDIIRPAFMVPETKPISELLREFQRKRIHLAVVVDEFGGTEGLITLEDILEEIVGDIRDEYDEEARLYDVLPEGVVDVDGKMNISDLNEHVDFVIPESDDYDTVGGFVTTLMGRIPAAGETCSFHHILIEVLGVDERRVTRVRFTPHGHTPDDARS